MLARLRSLLGASERREATGTLRDPWTTFILGGAGPTASGIDVSPETAMRCAPVLGAIRVLSETVSQLPVHLYQRTSDGGRERADNHPVEALLADAANEWLPASEFRLVLQIQLALHGNAYAWVGRTADGAVAELIPLASQNVSVEPDRRTLVPRYIVTDGDGRRLEYDRQSILHIRGVGSSLYVGDSPVRLAREAIALSLVMEKHGARLFGRGARPAGALKHKGRLHDDTAGRLRHSFESMFSGGDNAGRTIILEDGMEFQQMQLSSVDAQFIELRRYQLEEIARIWRIPPVLLGSLERATFSNVEELGQQFISFTMMPILRAWQDSLRLTLLTPEERRAGYFIEFLIDDLARANLAARFTAYSQAIAAGVLNPNEVRSMENRGGYTGGEVYTRPVNSAPVKRDGSAEEPGDAG